MLRKISADLAAIARDHHVGRDDLERVWVEVIRESASMQEPNRASPRFTDTAQHFGEKFAEGGRPLREGLDVLAAVRRTARETLLVNARAGLFVPELVTLGIVQISFALNAFVVGFNRGHLQVELEQRAQMQAQQDAFVWHALTGTSPSGDDFIRHDLYGLDGAGKYYAIRSRSGSRLDFATLEAHLQLDGDQPRVGMATVINEDLCGFTTLRPDNDPNVIVGVSGPVAFSDLPYAFRRSTRALEVANRLGLTGTHTMESLGLLLSVVADDDIANMLTAAYLTPVLALGEQGEILLSTVRAYLDHDCQTEATAQAISVHPNSVRYRLASFEKVVGVSIRDTQTLAELWWVLNLVPQRHDAES